MKNELVKQESNVPSIYSQPSETVLSSDFTIPKILQMQALSDWVTDGKAKPGDFVRSGNVQVLGGKNKPLDFIPLTFLNFWMISENENGDNKTFEFKGYEERNPLNEHLEWEYFENGVKCKRTKVMNLFALLPQDVDAQDNAFDTVDFNIDAAILPVVIPLRNTSYKAAKPVGNIFKKTESMNAEAMMKMDSFKPHVREKIQSNLKRFGVAIPVFSSLMRLSNVLEKNEKGSYFVLDISHAGQTPEKYLDEANKWRNIILSMGRKVKLDEGDVAAEAVKEAGEVFSNQF